MDLILLLSFLGASILLSLMPGPDNIFVLTESITKGHKNGVAVSVGLCSGVLVHTLAAATGLSLILMQSAVAFSIIKYLGAAYLLYLAYKASQDTMPNLQLKNSTISTSFNAFPLIRKGFLMNVLNPKVSLFFIAFLPQFVSPDGYHPVLQMMILGAVFMLQALIIFSGIALLSGRLSRFVHRPRFWHVTKWTTVAVLSTLGLSLALSEK